MYVLLLLAATFDMYKPLGQFNCQNYSCNVTRATIRSRKWGVWCYRRHL